MNREALGWYVARARRMTPAEYPLRAAEQLKRHAWRRRQTRTCTDAAVPARVSRAGPVPLDAATAYAIPDRARDALLATADALLAGSYVTLGAERHDLVAPDWFLDPVSGRRAPSDRYAFDIQHRSEAETGNVKQVWELSRHQHLTVLAAAYYVTHDDRHAQRVAKHLLSWWRANPFLTGIHWTSGIEVGLRLIAWAWIRRLLDDWPAIDALFDDNDLAVRQLAWHQQYLARFESHGSSANNHAIAEAAGLLVASCAFPWFEQSTAWRTRAAGRLQRALARNTFPSGVNRELASEYHGFVLELAYVAAIEAETARSPLDDATWARICRMTDAAAALTDETGRPPRQGDGDAGIALRVDGDDGAGAPWGPLLALGAAVFGPCRWWPRPQADVWSTLLASLLHGQSKRVDDRPACRPDHFADAGITILRTRSGSAAAAPEIWCRCDAGPHGFLKTSAHAHADALAIEVRHGGVDVLADPGTYCYHTEPSFRSYFRSTRGHNTVEIAGCDQSRSGGPFLWLRAARARILAIEPGEHGEIRSWRAEHDGYKAVTPGAVHRRAVSLDAAQRTLTIDDEIETRGRHAIACNFHLGPDVTVELDGESARLEWYGGRATMRLANELHWSVHRGEVDPVCGWYSPSFGTKTQSATLVGTGLTDAARTTLHTTLEFHDARA